MSDFLSQFSDSKYTPKKVPEKQTAIKPPEHQVEIDGNFKKKKTIKSIILAIVVIVVGILAFNAFKMANRVKVLDFQDKELSEMKIWALKNDIEVDVKYEFSLKIISEKVIEQSAKKGSYLNKKDVINVVVSKGPDVEEKIILPDFATMTYDEISTWISNNKLSNTYTNFVFSETVLKNQFIRYEITEPGVDSNSFRRKNSMNIYFSKGQEEAPLVTLVDFVGKSKTEAETFAKTNGIFIKFSNVESATVLDGMIVSQSKTAPEKIKKGETITMSVSIGTMVVIPNYNTSNKDNAQAVNGNVTLKISTAYSYTVPYGSLISQSINPFVKLKKDSAIVSLIFSEGKPFIDDLNGKIEKELPAYFFDLSSKGATVTYTTVYVDSAEKKGEVVYASKVSEYLEPNVNVIIHISKGNL